MAESKKIERVGVIGDVHTEHILLNSALNELRRRSLDAIFCVGDIVDGLGDADATISLLRLHKVLAVQGNHDRWFLNGESMKKPTTTTSLLPHNRDWLQALPATRRFATSKGGLLLCHGVGENDMAELHPETEGFDLSWITELGKLRRDLNTNLMIGGHTHKRMVRAFEGLTVINAGTLCSPSPGFIIIDLRENVVHCFDFTDGVVQEETLNLPIP